MAGVTPRVRQWVAALAVGCGLFSVGVARAEGAEAPVLMVIQSGIANDGGLRGELARRFGLQVTTLRKSGVVTSSPPRAVLAVALDERGALNALYWDRTGAFDVLSSAAPREPAALATAVITLASAVVQRHLEALRGPPPASGPAVDPSLDEAEMAERLAMYSALMRLRPTSRLAAELKVDDF